MSEDAVLIADENLKAQIDILRTDNARLRQQLQSLVEAWKVYQKAKISRDVNDTLESWDALGKAIVQLAQETDKTA